MMWGIGVVGAGIAGRIMSAMVDLSSGFPDAAGAAAADGCTVGSALEANPNADQQRALPPGREAADIWREELAVRRARRYGDEYVQVPDAAMLEGQRKAAQGAAGPDAAGHQAAGATAALGPGAAAAATVGAVGGSGKAAAAAGGGGGGLAGRVRRGSRSHTRKQQDVTAALIAQGLPTKTVRPWRSSLLRVLPTSSDTSAARLYTTVEDQGPRPYWEDRTVAFEWAAATAQTAATATASATTAGTAATTSTTSTTATTATTAAAAAAAASRPARHARGNGGITASALAAVAAASASVPDPQAASTATTTTTSTTTSTMETKQADQPTAATAAPAAAPAACSATAPMVFCVFDGHGSAGHGSVAARFCIERLRHNLRQHHWSNCEQALKAAFRDTDVQFAAECPASAWKAGTTALVAVVGAKSICIANAGDSRAVMSVNGRAKRLTHDHKASSRSEAARIARSGGTITTVFGPSRVVSHDGKHGLAVSRALGDNQFKGSIAPPVAPADAGAATATATAPAPAPAPAGATVAAAAPARAAFEPVLISDPELTHYELQPGRDEFLVMASDGIWDVLSDEAVIAIVANCGARNAASEVAAAARRNGSHDNISVTVIHFKRGAHGSATCCRRPKRRSFRSAN